ncbi:MAG: efflux RND transporter periplasmic adaptor subunit [Gammaproteobacteria bacterium]|nr:efflux RND transporter periplasmic adaptor subunit [Gammaproteobacteria bacterium]
MKANRMLGKLVALWVVVVSTSFVGLLTMSNLQASRVVVPDMDCVVEPSNVVELGFSVPGLIQKTYFDRADFVSKGRVMSQLESGVEEASLAIARENARHETGILLRKKSADYGERTRLRNARLASTDSISAQAMDQVNTETAIAKLQVRQEQELHTLSQLEFQQALAILERRSIVSPIEGTIIERYKSEGEYVDNDPVFKLAQLDPLHIEVIVPIELLGTIETGMKGGVVINAPGFENETLEALVRRIDAVGDAASGTYGVRLEMANPDLTIPSGVRCMVNFFAS